jgi:hypothetical protein
MVKRLIRLYPARWRRRYGAEMARLLDDLAPLSRGARLRIAFDVLLGALDARLSRDFDAGTGAVRAIGVAVGAAVVGWVPVGALIYLATVVFPSSNDTTPWFPAGFLYLMVAFPVIGAVASRACARPWSWPLAGAAAGIVMAALVSATFAWVDKAFFGVVSEEQIQGFRSSGMTSLRDFINLSLEHQVLGSAIMLTVIGVLMGTIGAICAAERRQDHPQTGRA